MFDIGFGEMVLLAAIALIAIGPKQLPEVARALGKLLGEVKKTVGEVTSTVANAREETDRAIRKVTSDLTDITDGINQDLSAQPIRKDSSPPPPITLSDEPSDHPGDLPWIVNPDIPKPEEVIRAEQEAAARFRAQQRAAEATPSAATDAAPSAATETDESAEEKTGRSST